VRFRKHRCRPSGGGPCLRDILIDKLR
jgi:hypothetical protein